MARDDLQLKSAKKAYKLASTEGNRQEEARWANVIGDILKQRGEYVEALRWLRIDYDVSVKHLPQKQLLPTCQSLGDIYLRLQRFKEALIYQKKHFELSKDTNDVIEQQRASTQLGRTYYEMFSRSENDHYAVQNAKKYFKLAMKLARTLKENPPANKSSFFLKEFIDAHNNLGMLEMELDNLDEAQKILLEGLKICDEEEVVENDDGRSRLHNNLGSLYMELRAWDKARQHIERDILICKRIGHLQGEAKGFINLGELHYRVQKYDEVSRCYQKALDIARSMEDEDALVDQINQNIKIVKEAVLVLEELKNEEQRLKKLTRSAVTARATPGERRCLLEQLASLDCLIEKSSIISAWPKHREFAKWKKRVASEVCDKEKLSDSFLAIGESYQKLRNFNKARKWYMKSWNVYRSIGNLEGQALVKINIGDVLDSAGDWAGALEAFEEGYRIAVQGNIPYVQLSALDNMHYSHMIRFDNVEEARKLQQDIQNLKCLLNEERKARNLASECCSETDTGGGDLSDNDGSDACNSLKTNVSGSTRSDPHSRVVEFDDLPLISFLRSSNNSSKSKKSQVDFHGKETSFSGAPTETFSRYLSKSIDNQQPVGRKRIRVVLSDDEIDEEGETDHSRGRLHKCPTEDVATSEEVKTSEKPTDPVTEFQDFSHLNASKDLLSACTPIPLEESACSFLSRSPKFAPENGMEFRSLSGGENVSNVGASGSKMDGGHLFDLQCQKDIGFNQQTSTDKNSLQHIIGFKIGEDTIHIDAHSCMEGDKLSIESMKAEVACLYYLQLSEEKRSKGLLPIIQHFMCGGKPLVSFDPTEDFKDYVCGNGWIEVIIDGWVQKRLMKLYIDCCKKSFEAPNMKLLKKLNVEVSEDEVIVSDCGLQDISISPFLSALQELKTISTLDISHNLLGNETMEKLQQIFVSSSQRYGGLTLDLHCNRFGPTALFQICECPVLFARLEVLNLSANRLTDACSSYLSTILKDCKALYSLNIEQCSITSRTVQKVADALDAGSVLAQLCLGKNNPISGNAMINLLAKLATLNRFSELNLNGVKLSKLIVENLCQVAKSSSLSGLILGGTNIGTDGAVQLTEALSNGPQELVKLDLSYCGLTSHDFARLCANITMIASVVELNLGGNSIGLQGADTMVSFLMNPECCLKVLILNKCHLEIVGVIRIIQALAENNSLEELNLAENADLDKDRTLEYDLKAKETLQSSQNNLNSAETSKKISASEEIVAAQQGLPLVDPDCNGLDVADSEDGPIGEGAALSSLDDSCASSCQRNPLEESELVQKLSTAMGMSKQLQFLDLSNNGFSVEVAEALYVAWSSISRCVGSAQKHLKEKIIHFSMEGKNCCGVKSCCKRN